VPDILAAAATLSHDGIVNIRPDAPGAFTVAIANVGAAAPITASADAGDLPVAVSMCPTDAATGTCLATAAPSVTRDLAAGATSTFTVFATTSGAFPFDPAAHRITVRFKDTSGVTRGLTSVAVRDLSTSRPPKAEPPD